MNTWSKVEAVLTLRDISQEDSPAIGRGVEVVQPSGFVLGSGDFVLFIHGFNVSTAQARESYAMFRGWFERFKTHSRVLELHWPGDRKWGWLSAACYPAKVDTAKQCGEFLAAWITKRQDARFTIVAHSLGCRLAVEAVAALRRNRYLHRISHLCLMAAAVPVGDIARRLLGPGQGEQSPRWRILYSRGDRVLRWTFAAGQRVSSDSVVSLPVGLHGEPLEHWKTAGDAWELSWQDDPTRMFYGHSDYWRGGPDALKNEPPLSERSLGPIDADHKRNSGASAELVAGTLNARVDRQIRLRHLPAAATLPERALQRAINVFDY